MTLQGHHFKDMSKMMQAEEIVAFCSLIASIQRCYGLWRLQEVNGARPRRYFCIDCVKMSHIGLEFGQNAHYKTWTFLPLEPTFGIELGLAHLSHF